MTKIHNYAFQDCSSLTSIELPDALTHIGSNLVNGTGITSLIVPASVNSFAHQEYSPLVTVDMSKCAVTNIEGKTFRDNLSLETLILPEGLIELSDAAIVGCPSVKRLDLPATLSNLYDGWSGDFAACESLTTIVWPAGLSDGSLFSTLPNLKNILYTGTQLQWDLTVSKDLFVDKTIITDYVPEG